MKVFIENEAGSNVKHHSDEKTLEPKGSSRVSRAYPVPYGFVLNTIGGDGDNVDCFVLTAQTLRTGQIVECEPLGLMEQIEMAKKTTRFSQAFLERGRRSMKPHGNY